MLVTPPAILDLLGLNARSDEVRALLNAKTVGEEPL